MDILSYLPSSSELNARSFGEWKKGSPSRRLTLTVPHSVSAKVGLSERSGSADVHYVVEVPDARPGIEGQLETRRGIAYVGAQSPDSIRMLMEDLRPRTSYSVSSVSQGIFDLRGLAYVCGVAAAAGSANCEVNFARNVSTMRLLSPSWTVPVAGELTVGPGIAASAREFVTLASMTYAAGLPRIQLMADLLPNVEVQPLQGCDLASYALKLFANLMAAAQSCACGSHHLLAFFRGMSSSWSLWAHTDEGGWIRKALASAVYPPGAGILALTTDEFMTLPLKFRMDPAETTRVTVGLYLVMASVIPVADCYRTGTVTVIDREPGGVARPSNFEGLSDCTYGVLQEWRELVCPIFGLHPSGISDRYSLDNYFSADKVDSHLDYDAVQPFWWVEPGPLYAYDSGKAPLPCQRGKVMHLPLINPTELLLPEIPQGRNHSYARGVRVGLVFDPGNLRMCGISYLFSGAYSAENGLSYFEHVVDEDLGLHTTDALFADPAVVNVASRRWVTPHNPIMNPSEGFIRHRYRLDYISTGKTSDPSEDDWSSCMVESTLGFFLLNEDQPGATSATHHYVPSGYARIMRYAYARVSDKHTYRRVLLKSVPTHPDGKDVTATTAPSRPSPPEEITPPLPTADPIALITEGSPVIPPPESSDPAKRVPLETNVGVKQGTDTLRPKDDGGSNSL